MRTGVQFQGTVAPGATGRWYTWGWNPSWHVIWYIMPTSPQSGAPQIDWDVALERANASQSTYWITVKNLTSKAVTFEARFAVLS